MKFKAANYLTKAFLFYTNKIGEHPSKLRILNNLHVLFKNHIKFRSSNGAVLQLTPKDYIAWKIITNGTYEPLSLNLALTLLKDTTGAFLDVGANIGLFSSIVAKSYPGKQIIAIEPEENNFNTLNKNIAANTTGNQINTLNIAVGESVKRVQLECPVKNNSGTFRVVAGVSVEDTETKYYPMQDLDTVLKGLKINQISLMKIDIEGYEMHAFKGMDWDSSYKPQHILVEYSDYVNRMGVTAEDLLHYLTERGYKPQTVEGKPYAEGDFLPEDNLWLSLS